MYVYIYIIEENSIKFWFLEPISPQFIIFTVHYTSFLKNPKTPI